MVTAGHKRLQLLQLAASMISAGFILLVAVHQQLYTSSTLSMADLTGQLEGHLQPVTAQLVQLQIKLFTALALHYTCLALQLTEPGMRGHYQPSSGLPPAGPDRAGHSSATLPPVSSPHQLPSQHTTMLCCLVSCIGNHLQ